MRVHRLLDPLLLSLPRLGGRSSRASGVLLISAGGLGDTVLFARVLPCFLDLAQPDETVTVLLRADAASMAFLFPAGVAVRTVDFSRLRDVGYRAGVFRSLYRGHYRLVVSTDYLRHPDLDESLVAAAAAPDSAAMEPRPSRRHGRRLARNRRLYRRLFASGPELMDKVERLIGLAGYLSGGAPTVTDLRLPPGQLPVSSIAPPTAPLAILQPFSAVAQKQSPPDLWRDIVAALPRGWDVRIAGHPRDLERSPEFRPLLDLPGVRFEPAPFRDLATLLRQAALVVSVDTGCMHLAAVVGAPTLCLASAAYVGEIVPYAASLMPPNLRVLHGECPSQGCLGQCSRPLERGMYPCVAALAPATVLEAVRDMVAQGRA